MLTAVEITNQLNGSLVLPLLDVSAGYVVKDVEGLSPVKATLTSSSMAQVDGAQPQNASRSTRNITMKIGLEPDYVTNNVQSLRSSLYGYLMPKTMIQFGVYLDDALYAVTSGQVESFDNTLFSADPEVDISIICYDPDFYAPVATYIYGNTSSDTNVTTVTYPGNSDTGITFELNVNTTVPSRSALSLYNTLPDNTVQVFNLAGLPTLIAGDVLTVSTVSGAKSVSVLRAGTAYSLLSYMDPTSTWLYFSGGNNNFRVFYNGTPIPYRLNFTPKYGAI